MNLPAMQKIFPPLLLLLLCIAHGGRVAPLNGLVLHFYDRNASCPHAEDFVRHLVGQAWEKDRSVGAALLRLVYSDCLVTGCDASILLDGKKAEKSAAANRGLRPNGFQLVDDIKGVMEAKCPGVVSCADIINLAAKEAVALAGAPRYPVYTGRRDGLHSTADAVDLPWPDATWEQALAYFDSKGLDVLDLGTLLGAHSLGMTHCINIQGRLYNFNSSGRADPSMDPRFLARLRKECPPGRRDGRVYLNPDSGGNYSFENSYYERVLKHRAVLMVDQQMITTADGVGIAREFAEGFEDLRELFALAMARMGGLGVLTGPEGEIRRNCRYVNGE